MLYFKERAGSRVCCTCVHRVRSTFRLIVVISSRNVQDRVRLNDSLIRAYVTASLNRLRIANVYARPTMLGTNVCCDLRTLACTCRASFARHLSQGLTYQSVFFFSRMFTHLCFVYFIRSYRFFARVVKRSSRVGTEPCRSLRLRCSFLRRGARVLRFVIIFQIRDMRHVNRNRTPG